MIVFKNLSQFFTVMKRNSQLLFILIFLLVSAITNAQSKKFDTTVKMGDQGFHVESSNKAPDKNDVTVSVINIRINSTNPVFRAPGVVTKAMVDDLNDDGKPDLMVCVYSGSNNEMGSIISISPTADKSIEPVYFPDIFLDPKIREGYKGYDQFSTLTGTLLRKFPIYLPTDTDKPTGGTRTIQYNVTKEEGRLSFKVLRFYDVKS